VTAEVLLSRLDGVRQTGPDRWIARCPAHDDGRASLSLRELDDGRVLLHDFAGCAVEEVLAAVGLTFDDLFPPRAIDQARRRERRPYSLRALASALELELTVGLLLLADAAAGKAVDCDRAALARERITNFLAELRYAS
jgi:hypothetical protein